MLGAVLFVASNFCFGTSFAFSNAFLPRLTRPEKQGSLSGWGFAAGYVGGALALIIVLVMINVADDRPYVRYGLALSGLWWLLFWLPAFILLDELPPQATDADGGPLCPGGLPPHRQHVQHLRHYRMLFLFLLAFLLYNDGVETVISMSGAFGTDQLKMTQEQLIVMFLIVQFVAFFGAVVFGYVADRIGNKKVIVINLVGLGRRGDAGVLRARRRGSSRRWACWSAWSSGGVQASSRALMALLSPEHIRNEAFGFFSISGKFASIFGPLLYGAARDGARAARGTGSSRCCRSWSAGLVLSCSSASRARPRRTPGTVPACRIPGQPLRPPWLRFSDSVAHGPYPRRG